MKKIALTLATVVAATVFAPEASALPAFARQTGMACSACHFQHFPIINGFGRAFKAAGYTMTGAQEKVEDEKLSLPSVLNSAVLLKARYQQTSGTNNDTVDGASTNSGQWQIPDELSLFFGGRVADSETIKIGMMMENNLAGVDKPTLIAGLRVPIVVDLGAAKLLVIPYGTDALGAFYGYTESSTGITRGIRWAEHRKEVSAHQYTGMGDGTASGVAVVAHTEFGYVNVSRFSPAFFYVPSTTGVAMTSTAITAAVTPTLADWAIVAGVQSLSGESRASAITPLVKTTGLGFDAQAHGELAGLATGLYATYAKTDADSMYGNKQASTVGAEVTVLPHALSLGAAYRNATTNDVADNAVTVTAVYDLFQNVALHANYTKYDTEQSTLGTSLFTGLLEMAW